MSENGDHNLAGVYHLNSSNSRLRIPDLTLDEDRRPFRFRTYPGSHRIALEKPSCDLSMSLDDVLKRRRSEREFTLDSFSSGTLATILYAGYGVHGLRRVEGSWTHSRPVPSAGGLYPLELYVATQQVDGVEDGIYHYDARSHELELRRPGVVHATLADMTIGQDMLRTANLVFIISAIVWRSSWKYGQRAYRYVLMESGHLGQNLYLIATALGLGVVSIGGFFDSEVNRLVRLPVEEDAVYLVAVGHVDS